MFINIMRVLYGNLVVLVVLTSMSNANSQVLFVSLPGYGR